MRDASFLGGITKNRDALFPLGDGISAEARETDGKAYRESLGAQIFMNGVSPLLR